MPLSIHVAAADSDPYAANMASQSSAKGKDKTPANATAVGAKQTPLGRSAVVPATAAAAKKKSKAKSVLVFSLPFGPLMADDVHFCALKLPHAGVCAACKVDMQRDEVAIVRNA